MSESRLPALQLPAKPDLRHLKGQAKELVQSGKSPSLSAALFQVAQAYGFPSWPKLKAYVIERTRAGELKLAISRDDLTAVKHLLYECPGLRTAPIGYGEAGPLTWAAECRGMTQPTSARLEIVEWLLASGSDIHEGGDAPLMRASLNSTRIEMMELLVRNGADVNVAWNGSYPIIFAPCETLDSTSLEWLLRHGADPNCGSEATWRSQGRQHPETALDYLLGTYLRNRDALNESIRLLRDAGGLSRFDEPGVISTIRGDSDSVKELLRADPSLIERRYLSLNIGTTAGRMLTLKGATLLHIAAEFGQAEVAKVLLDSGADANATALIDSEGQGGQSPIFHAATQNDDFGIDVVRLLISRGTDLSLFCRLPGHYERPNEVFEGNVLAYARQFPGNENKTLEELHRLKQA